MQPNELSKLQGYKDFGEEKELVIWPWDISFNSSDRTFIFPLNIEAKYGIYYIQIFYNIKDTIHYGEPTEGVVVPQPNSLLGGCLVLRYDKEETIVETNEHEIVTQKLPDLIFVSDIKIMNNTDNTPDNYIDRSIYIINYS